MKNLEKLLPLIEKELGKKVNLNKTYLENDIDSLDAVSLLGLVEDEYKIKLDAKDLIKIKDFRSLEALIHKNLK